jgi:two-component sensor histidine kinase
MSLDADLRAVKKRDDELDARLLELKKQVEDELDLIQSVIDMRAQNKDLRQVLVALGEET